MTDVLGRSWQMGTIQLDSQMPARFGLTYMGADNAEHTPYVVHRALFGSLERFMGILIEHYGGAFPVWLAPVQVRVDPGRRATTARPRPRSGREARPSSASRSTTRDETVGKRIRNAEVEKIPYVVVCGDKESEDALAVRERGGGAVDEVASTSFWTSCVRLLRCEPAKQGRHVPHLRGQACRGFNREVEKGSGRCRAAAFVVSRRRKLSSLVKRL